MIKCANCSEEALYTYHINSEMSVNYCFDCLPRFLYPKRNAGLLPLEIPEVVSEVVPEEPIKLTKKKVTDTVAETTVAE